MGTYRASASFNLPTASDATIRGKVMTGQPHALPFNFPTPVTAAKVIVTANPVGAIVATPFSLTVNATDVSNVLASSYSGSATVTKASGPGTLSGTVTASFVGGVLTFPNLILSAAGTYTLTISSGTLAPATTASFTVSLPATKLAFTTQPVGDVSGSVLPTQPVITVQASDNSTATYYTGPVTIAVATGPSTLTGTITLNAVAGIVTFTDLILSGVGTDTLIATASGLTSATSSSVTTTPVVYLSDTFSGTSASIGGRTPDTFGSNWVLDNGTIGVASGVATATVSDSQAHAPCGTANVHVQSVPQSGHQTGILGRRADANNFYGILGGFGFFTVIGGSRAGISTYDPTIPNNKTLDLGFNGPRIVSWCGGKPYMAITNTNAQTAQNHGLWLYGQTSDSCFIDSDLSYAPYSAGTPYANIVFYGDSITAGYTNTTPDNCYEPQTMAQYNLIKNDFRVRGIDGQTTTNLIADAPTGVYSLYNGTVYNRNIVVLWVGTNDISGGATGSATYTSYITLAQNLINQGFEVIAVTMLPRGSSLETNRTAFNSALRSDTTHFVGLVDLDTDSVIGAAGANSNTTYYSDGTHLTAAGNLRVANIAASTLNTVLSRTSGVPSYAFITQQPSNAAQSAVIAPSTTVRLYDSNNQPCYAYATAVVASIKSGTGTGGVTLGGTTSRTPTNGVVIFNDLTINTAGTAYQLHFTTGSITVDSTALDITVPVTTYISATSAGAFAGADSTTGWTVDDSSIAFAGYTSGSSAPTGGVSSHKGYIASNPTAAGSCWAANSSHTDGTGTLTVSTFAGGQVGLFARVADGTHYVVVWNDGSHLYLDKNTGASYFGNTNVVTVAYTPADGDAIQLIASGTSFTVKVNGVTKIAATTISDASLQTGTKWGYGSGGTSQRITSLTVTS